MYLTFQSILRFLPLVLSVHLVSGWSTARSSKASKYSLVKRIPSNFVTTSGSTFKVNGSDFRFIGTNAYWLPTLNSEQDVVDTLGNMSATGIKVVRIWAFNDVPTIPTNGTWFQLIANGTTSVNTGANGLQKLDTVIQTAERMGMYIILSLTNNWNPLPLLDGLSAALPPTVSRRDVTPGTNNSLPRNFLSNDYGGIDAYIRGFGGDKMHDNFYTNDTLINAFTNYTTQVVQRYVNSSAVFAWEIANDPRCNSTLPSTTGCTTNTITQWHSTVAQHIAEVDPNHLIASGTQGFICTSCKKLFPRITPPPPTTSATPAQRKVFQTAQKREEVISKSASLKKRVLEWREKRDLKEQRVELKKKGTMIRGRWQSVPAVHKRQDAGLGSAFDGSQGIDFEDIINIPQIGFSSFQLFPDQNQYATPDAALSQFNNTVNAGLAWIETHARLAQIFGKPISLTGFGLVTQKNAPDFVPFNLTSSIIGNSTVPASNSTPIGVTNAQQQDAYSQWISQSIASGLSGILQYQWSQANLTVSPGTSISPNTTGISIPPSTTGESPVANTTEQSPNDGYANQGVGQDGIQGILSNASQQIVGSG